MTLVDVIALTAKTDQANETVHVTVQSALIFNETNSF